MVRPTQSTRSTGQALLNLLQFTQLPTERTGPRDDFQMGQRASGAGRASARRSATTAAAAAARPTTRAAPAIWEASDSYDGRGDGKGATKGKRDPERAPKLIEGGWAWEVRS